MNLPPTRIGYAQVEINTRCNWHCVHCYHEQWEEPGPAVEVMLHRIDRLADAGVFNLTLTGGEPFLYQHFRETVEHARRRGMVVTSYSNGHAIRPSQVQWLRANVASLEISLLAGTAEVNDYLTGRKGAFANTTARVEQLVQAGVHVLLKTPILAPAVPTLPALKDWVERLGLEWLPELRIDETQSQQRDVRQYSVTDPHDIAQVEAIIPGITAELLRTCYGCRAGRKAVFVDVKGNVFPCLQFKATYLRGGPNAKGSLIGNIDGGRPLIGVLTDARIIQQIALVEPVVETVSPAYESEPRHCMARSLEEHGVLDSHSDAPVRTGNAKTSAFLGIPVSAYQSASAPA